VGSKAAGGVKKGEIAEGEKGTGRRKNAAAKLRVMGKYFPDLIWYFAKLSNRWRDGGNVREDEKLERGKGSC